MKLEAIQIKKGESHHNSGFLSSQVQRENNLRPRVIQKQIFLKHKYSSTALNIFESVRPLSYFSWPFHPLIVSMAFN